MNQANLIVSAEYGELNDLRDITNSYRWDDINWDSIKNKVEIRYINYNLIDYKYKEVLYKKFLDLAKVIHIENKDDNNNPLSYIITNNDIEFLKVSEEEIFNKAEENTKYNKKIRLFGFKDYLNRLNNPFFAISEINQQAKIAFSINNELTVINDSKVLILSRIDNAFGSSYCFLPDILNQVKVRLKDSFYIIPLSIHQVMYVSKEYVTNNKEIYEAEQDIFYMINSINKDLSWKNILSYNIYYYDKSIGNIMTIKNNYT